MYINDVVIDII